MVIKRIKGDTYPIDIQLERVDGSLIDITGSTIFFTVKRNLEDEDSDALISKDITSFSSPLTGEFSIPLISTDVDYIGEFFYDVKIKYATGLIESVFTDKFILSNHTTLRTS